MPVGYQSQLVRGCDVRRGMRRATMRSASSRRATGSTALALAVLPAAALITHW